MQEVSYVGHILTKDGVKPDVSQIQAITAMPPPEDKKGVQRLLGMTNYLSKFIPNYSGKTTPLRELLHKDVEFCWLQHQEVFETLKSELIKPTTLQYYDVKKPVVLTCDASQSGLVAVMIQEEKPVVYASRALTETEIRYSQIEKELLAITLACRKFRDYIYGKEITIETDQLHIADALSRAYLPRARGDSQEDEEEFEVLELTCIWKRRADQIREAIQESDEQQELMKYILSGWPIDGKNLSAKIKLYYAFRDELVIEDGIIVKQQRVVIPKSLQKEYLIELHRGHPGKDATKARALDTVYWTGINEDIEKMIASCTACNRH